MLKLFKSKKAQIPIVSDIANFISSAVSWLTQSAPKPFKIIFFLILLLFGTVVLTFAVRMLGNHCDSAGNPYQLSAFAITKNWELIQKLPNVEQLNLREIPTEDVPLFGSISSTNVGKCSQKYLNSASINGQSANNIWWYDGSFCTNCDTITIDLSGQGSETYCTSDVYPVAQANKTLLQKTFCGGWLGGCEPPAGYYWQQTTNLYLCNTPTTCSTTSTIGEYWNQQLISAGATPIYPAGYQQSLTAENAFSIQCTQDLKPEFRLWNIPVFNYQLWIFLSILMLLFIVLKFVLQHR